MFSVITVSAQIPQYSVSMTPANYDTLYTRDPFSDVYLPCTFDFEGTAWNNASIRFKGHSTRYYPKKSYRLRFSSSNLFQGVAQFNFNAMYTDKSFIREKLVWDLFEEMNFLAPRAHHAKPTINGGDKGLYLFIDKIDRYFLSNRGRVIAPMYEANDFYISADMTLQPDSVLKLYYDKAIGSSTDYSDLTQLLTAINMAPDSSFADTVFKYFDVASVLHWFTGNTLTMMGDSYTKNYFLYHDTSKPIQQWVIIPWDYDISFGRSGDLAIPYPASLLNDGFAYTFPPLAGPSNVLKDRCWNTASLKELFRLRVDTLLQTLFTEQHLFPRIDSLSELIQNDVMMDQNKWGTYEDFLEHIDALKYYITARRNYLIKTFINAPSGNYNDVTLQPTQLGIPYHFVGYDGRQIATLWFTSISGMDSLRIQAYPDLVPSHAQNPSEGRFVKRWIRITPYPDTARFAAKLQWMYDDVSSTNREVGVGVQDERLLKCYYHDGTAFVRLASSVNAFGNFVDVDSITEAQCSLSKYFALLIPETYDQKWYRQANNYWQRWYDVKFIDAQNGFVLGDQGTILRTTDAGATWAANSIGLNLPFHSLGISSPDNMFAVGEHGACYRSLDTGKTWMRVELGTTSGLRGVKFLNAQKGWIFGEGGAMYETNNGGASWNGVSPESLKTIIGIAPQSANAFSIFFEDGYAIRTLNGGGTWSPITTATTGKLNAVDVLGSQTWIVGDGGLVAHSINSTTWVSIPVPTAEKLRGVCIFNPTSAYVAGDNGKIYYTVDDGANWYAQYTADSHDLNALVFTDSTHGYAVGNGGTILTTMSSGTLTEVRPIITQVPSEFKLFQNYPNPFNPTTNFRFRIPARPSGGPNFGFVRLEIFDVLGREVATIVSQQLQPGEYQIPFDGSKLASGVYFYRLDVTSRTGEAPLYSHVNKMLLLK